MADATTATTPKIEELRARLKADPKSRHFYPLAEELRKLQHLEEAEQILRDGLQNHGAYLSAWISLGRVLRDRSRDHEAVEVLKRALTLDPGNVVAAKLLAQAYLGIGDKVEAIKKFKLVFAMMPSDEEVEQSIEALDRELNPDKYPAEPEAAPLVVEETSEPVVEESPLEVAEEPAPISTSQPFAMTDEPSRFDATDPVPFGEDEEPFGSTADSVMPSHVAPREEPPAELLAPEEPLIADAELGPGEVHADAPIEREAEPFGDVDAEADVELVAPSVGEQEAIVPDFDGTQPNLELIAPAAHIPATMTMAQLYERQGHDEQAAQLYRQILEQQPDNEQARAALSKTEQQSGGGMPTPLGKRERIRRLEQWRARMVRS